MKINGFAWAAGFVAVSALSLLLYRCHADAARNGRYAEISVNGEIVEVIDLKAEDSEGFEKVFEFDGGGSNTIKVENGRIAVIDANCPDKICVRRGFISGGELPIVCLPHKLSITVTDKDVSSADAVSGGI